MDRLKVESIKDLPTAKTGTVFVFNDEQLEWYRLTSENFEPLWLSFLLDNYEKYPKFFKVITNSNETD